MEAPQSSGAFRFGRRETLDPMGFGGLGLRNPHFLKTAMRYACKASA